MIRFPRTRLVTRLVVFVLSLGAAGLLSAAEPLDIDLDLLDALNELKLFEYSRLHVEQMLRAYPQAKDQILVAKARTLFLARATAEAEAAIKQVPANSPYYPQAMLLVGSAYARVRNYDAAAKAYAIYFRKGEVEKHLPDGGDEDAVAEFRRHVSTYKSVLEKQGNIKEAQRIVGLLGMIKGGANERGTRFLQLRTALDAEERKLDERKDVDQAVVAKALAELGELVFLRDGVGALSYVETARCHVILGGSQLNAVLRKGIKEADKLKAELGKNRHFITAVKGLKTAAPFLEDMAKAQGGGDELLGGALFYQGKAYRGQALLMHFQKQEAKAEKLMKAAAQCFEKVAADYGESRFQTPALAEHEKCRQNADSLFGVEIELAEGDGSAALQLNLEKGHSLFQRQDYKGAIPLYLAGARAGRLSKKLPTVVSPLVVAMGEEGYFIEAEALASYLVEVLPKDEVTALCVLQLGASLKKAAKAENDPARKRDLEARENNAWEWFVQVAPLDNRAPVVAAVVADYYYRNAVAAGRQAKEEKDPQRRQALLEEARRAMDAAIPKFQFVVDQYATSPQVPEALYKLGWCYYETDRRKEAAETFLRYADDDELEPKLSDRRLQAKFRAAECMMLGDQPEESVAEFKALVDWTAADNDRRIDATTATAKRLRDAARMEMGYAYDQTAEALRPQLAELQDKAKAAVREVARCEKQIAADTERLAALPQDKARLDQQTREVRSQYATVTLDFRAEARKAALAMQDEDPDKLDGELRATALQKLGVDTERMLKVQEEQARQNVAGEQAGLDTEVREIRTAKAALAKHVDQLVGEVAEVRKQLPAPAGLAEPQGEGAERLPALAAILDAGTKALEEEVAQAKAKRDKTAAELDELVQELNALEVKRQALEASVATLRDDVDATNDAVEKARRTAKLDQADGEQKDTKAKLDAGYDRRVTLEKESAEAEKRLAERAATLAAAGAKARDLARDCRHAVLQDGLLSARLGATAQVRPFCAKLGEALAKPVAARANFRDELTRLGSLAAKAVDAVHGAKLALLDEEESILAERLAENKAALAGAKAAAAASETALKPVQERFEDWKRQAVGAFDAYLKAPGGDAANQASVLAKLGTVHLELKDFPKAEEALARLAKEHPDSEAGKGALFNLARAQFETGKRAEAGRTFGEILAKPADISLPNLQYIGRAMLEAGQFDTALKACEEIVARSGDKSHADYAQAQVIRPPSLYRAGCAALGLKRPKDTLKYLDALLKENPRSGFFFEVKFATAEARTLLTPPDLAGAERDLDEAFDSRDPVIKNRADYQLGAMWTGTKDRELVKKGVERLRIVVELADPAVPENRPWIEKSAFAAARAYARLGQGKERDAMVAFYRKSFPQGEHLDQLGKLPPAEFRE